MNQKMEKEERKVLFKDVVLANFVNYNEYRQNEEEVDEETRESNFEMTEQEIESLSAIFNETEVQLIDLDQIEQSTLNFENITQEILSENGIKFLVRLSLVPKYEEDKIKFVFKDLVMKNEVSVCALPAIELIFALPESYPSNQKPLFLQSTKFYSKLGFEEFIIDQINQKWSEDMPVLYEIGMFLQDEFMELYEEEIGFKPESEEKGVNIRTIEFNDAQEARLNVSEAQKSYRRQFDEEQHTCGICCRDQLGAKFFFMSGCEHYFCRECITQMVIQKLQEGNITDMRCAEASCKKALNDLDVKKLKIDPELEKKYEQLSVTNAIAQMDDMGWCPLTACKQLAIIEKEQNSGKCTFCDFHFCLDCKDRIHPYKRCKIHRIDVLEEYKEHEVLSAMRSKNKISEEILNKLFMKWCTKSCPNSKCGVPISKDPSGCSQVQCTKCFSHFCWTCGASAKGQKHYKENPNHWSDEDRLLPYEVTEEIIAKSNQDVQWVNLKFTALCPSQGCVRIHTKTTNLNLLYCSSCKKSFCYICNKNVEGKEHYQTKGNCRLESDPYSDL